LRYFFCELIKIFLVNNCDLLILPFLLRNVNIGQMDIAYSNWTENGLAQDSPGWFCSAIPPPATQRIPPLSVDSVADLPAGLPQPTAPRRTRRHTPVLLQPPPPVPLLPLSPSLAHRSSVAATAVARGPDARRRLPLHSIPPANPFFAAVPAVSETMSR
jgi:hypothetical protein